MSHCSLCRSRSLDLERWTSLVLPITSFKHRCSQIQIEISFHSSVVTFELSKSQLMQNALNSPISKLYCFRSYKICQEWHNLKVGGLSQLKIVFSLYFYFRWLTQAFAILYAYQFRITLVWNSGTSSETSHFLLLLLFWFYFFIFIKHFNVDIIQTSTPTSFAHIHLPLQHSTRIKCG